MTFSSRIAPEDSFPEHLEQLSTDDLEILNSKVHRQAELEYQQTGEAELETRFRLEFVAEELDVHEESPAPVEERAVEAPEPAPLARA